MRLIRMLAMAVLTLSAAIVPSTSATAAEGGCIDAVGSGWNVGVCSSDNGSTVFADLYVNSRGSTGSSCEIRRWIGRYNSGGTSLEIKYPPSYAPANCALGHKSNISAPKVSGKWYREYMWVVVNGRQVLNGFSKWTT